jgi:Domain of unknown function (DUF4266)
VKSVILTVGRQLVPGSEWKYSRVARGLFVGLALAASACATVAPYERERLARPDMELSRNSDARAGEEHATQYREGSTGGLGASGGGCGCN